MFSTECYNLLFSLSKFLLRFPNSSTSFFTILNLLSFRIYITIYVHIIKFPFNFIFKGFWHFYSSRLLIQVFLLLSQPNNIIVHILHQFFLYHFLVDQSRFSMTWFCYLHKFSIQIPNYLLWFLKFDCSFFFSSLFNFFCPLANFVSSFFNSFLISFLLFLLP